MFAQMDHIHIRAIASAIPENTNDLFQRSQGVVSEKKAKRMVKSIGFERFTTAPDGVTAGDMCLIAAEKLLHELNYAPDAIDAVLFLSQVPDYISPPTSCILQSKLGIGNHAITLDINHGCPGYVYGLYVAASLIRGGSCRSVLLCVGDTKSKLLFPADVSTQTVFGDAGTATLIERGNDTIQFGIDSYGNKYDTIMLKRGAGKLKTVSLHDPGVTVEQYRENFYQMDGVAVMDFTLSEVPVSIKAFADAYGIDFHDVDLFAIHQANKMIVESIANNLGISLEKAPFTARYTGNTSSASIPLMLSEMGDGHTYKKVLASGFGVGLAIANACFDLSTTQLLGKVVI